MATVFDFNAYPICNAYLEDLEQSTDANFAVAEDM
jgi:hypothetical protein